ncbi:MAG TPA: hypothetical protein VGR55_05955 [Candidatus Acidoferrum sp.]|nr:hypothetical protein [Candidatus Acidoferrum sp.]
MRKLGVLSILCLALILPPKLRAQNNAELKGDYAFTFNGMTTGGGNASTPFAAVGRFTADGAGNLTNGELDSNGVGPMEKAVALAFTGTYSIGADHRGVMSLNIPGGGMLAFAMMANGNAKFVEVDASGGHGTVGSGSMEKVDTTAFSTARITGDYAFGAAGLDQSNNRTAMAGRFTANGSGMLGNGAADVNQSGTFTTLNLFVGTYMVTDATTGRGIISLPPLVGGAPQNLNFSFYVVNAGKLLAMEMDAVSPLTPLLNGIVLQQQTPVGGFSTTALNGNTVMDLTGRTICPGGTNAAPNVIAGLLSTNGVGIANLTYDQNCGGGSSSVTGLSGTYSVAGNGRSAFRLGGAFFAAYLVAPNQAFFIVPDSSVLFGFGDAQAVGPFTNSAITGRYAGSATMAASLGVTMFSGEFTADGASPAGSIAGTEDIGAPNGASLGVIANATYTISSSPTSGRGSISGSIGGSGIVYVISPLKFVVISLSDPNPAVLLFEQ